MPSASCTPLSPPSWNWNSVDVGPQRDLARELADAVRAENLTQGFYFSLFEWFHPLYLQDKANNFTTTTYVDQIMLPQLKVRWDGAAAREGGRACDSFRFTQAPPPCPAFVFRPCQDLVTNYQPDLIWADGGRACNLRPH